jgi:hypothetical protein
MKLSLYRSLKKVYRHEPISAVILIMAMTDILLGGMSENWTLLSFGLLMVMMGIFVHWLQQKKPRKSRFNSAPRRYLAPSRTSLTPLPPLKRKRDYQ